VSKRLAAWQGPLLGLKAQQAISKNQNTKIDQCSFSEHNHWELRGPGQKTLIETLAPTYRHGKKVA